MWEALARPPCQPGHTGPSRPNSVPTKNPTWSKPQLHFTLTPLFVYSSPTPQQIPPSSSTMSNTNNGGDDGSGDEWDAFPNEVEDGGEELALRIMLQCSRVDTGSSSDSAPSPVATGRFVGPIRTVYSSVWSTCSMPLVRHPPNPPAAPPQEN